MPASGTSKNKGLATKAFPLFSFIYIKDTKLPNLRGLQD